MAIISFTMLSFLCSLLLVFISTSQISTATTTQNSQYFCDQNNDSGNYTTNSTYHTNLNTLLSTLTSNKEINYGFYNFSYGENTNKVNAIGLCRGDVRPNNCRSCLNGSIANLTRLCPNRKEAIFWSEDERCMLRYSSRSIFGLNETGPAYFVWNLNNATNEDQFNKVVTKLLDSLRSNAASGDTRIKYATAKAVGPNNQTIYGLVQCTPDLSKPMCDNCLVQSITEIPHCCNNRIGARVVRPSCNVRYETSLFYEPTSDSDSPSSSPSPAPSSPSPSSPLPMTSSPSPLPVPSLPSPPAQNTSSEDKGNTSKTVVAKVSLLLILLCSFLCVSI